MTAPLKFNDGKEITFNEILDRQPKSFIRTEEDFKRLNIYLSGFNPKSLKTKLLEHCLRIYWAYSMHPSTRAGTTSDINLITTELARRNTRNEFWISIFISILAISIAGLSFKSAQDSSKLSEVSLNLVRQDIKRESQTEEMNLETMKLINSNILKGNEVQKRILDFYKSKKSTKKIQKKSKK